MCSGFVKRLFVPWHLHSPHFKTSSPSWHWDVWKGCHGNFWTLGYTNRIGKYAARYCFVFQGFLFHSGLMRLSSTKLPVTSQWLAMIYNKKRVGKIPVKRKWNYSLILRVYHYTYLFTAKFSTNDNGFRLAKQHLCTSNTLCFLHFLYCRSTTSTSNSLFPLLHRGREQKTPTLNLDTVLLE